MKTRTLALVLVLAGFLSMPGSTAARATVAQDDEQLRALLLNLERAVRSGDPAGCLALTAASADQERAGDFCAVEVRPGPTRVVLKERDREPLADPPEGNGYRLVVDAFVEFGDRARAATWQLEITRASDNTWKIANQEHLSAINSLYRLALNRTKQFVARDFAVRAEDLDLILAGGSVFTVDTAEGVTALVLLGQGVMRFHPTPQTEKGQIKIFAGAETLESRFDAALVKVGNVESHADMSKLVARPVDPRELRRAEEVFQKESPKSFAIDLSDLTNETWSLLPGPSDVIAEVRTRRFDTLTYSRSEAAAEDISLFDRARQKNIAVYTSAERLARRGRFYDEDDTAVYDVLDYEIDLAFAPDRRWIDARAQMRIRIRAGSTNQLTLRLAESLAVRSVTSKEFGRLFSVRVKDHDTLLVSLPVLLLQDAEATITVEYSGRIAAQPGEWESLPFTQRDVDVPPVDPIAQALREPVYLNSTRAFWYPRAPVFDYATATLRIAVPVAFDCIASGEQAPSSPMLLDDNDPIRRRKLFVFTAERPLRYLAFLVTRLSPVDRVTIAFSDDEDGAGRVRGPAMGGAVYNSLALTVLAQPRAIVPARTLVAEGAEIAQFYRSIVGDSPYSSLTLALVEGATPGGHSPGYFAAIRQAPENAPRVWRNDPAAFDNYPEFFPAHEIAHQWWGQAVGWNTYHDQWLSEGFAQYFAALYTGRQRGDDTFRAIMRQMRKWAIDESDQGPVFLGYRLGHVRDDGRVFRALVYDKGAAVLHMLRRLVGDDAFFLGIRRFYAGWRFQKPGTEDFRAAMEAEAGRSLERFFEGWIYGSSLPRLKFSYRVEPSARGRDVVLRVDQTGELFDVPVTVVLQYADQPSVEVVIPVTDRSTEMRVALTGTLRNVEISKDDGTLADIQKN